MSAMVGVIVGRVEEPGRYRRSKAARRPVKRVAFFSVVLAVPAAIALYPAPVDDRPTAEDSIAAAERASVYGRSDIRGTSEPAPAPTQVATLAGRIVNNRLQPEPVDPPTAAEGDYTVVGGSSPPPDGASGDVVNYLVEVEEGLPFDPDGFAAAVHTVLNDERGWGPEEDMRFKRVDDGDVRFRVSLSSPDMTDAQCYPLRTRGEVSCWNGSRSVINAKRWGTGSETFDGDILTYREYLINHEVGHALGHGHENCPGKGELAPVMVQQTKSLEGCDPNPWPSL